ncbi:HXXXD-type acyl-transferase family protein [Prunus dulcis]|uniref:HXXXD-type acyl-transferase family protein n=1 Tax=Prunus dulcis TaxID=3755 RepID=A0A5H2XM10_PRUDU|nr:HXXXD-type acyl-transferase family protein [Prunus dulcis]
MQGRLCRNFGRKSRSLVSGPGIGVMSGIPKGSSGFWENLGRPPLGLLFTAAVFGPPPPHPATTRGGTGPQKNRAVFLFPSRLVSAPAPTGARRNQAKTDRFSPDFQTLRSPSFLGQIVRIWLYTSTKESRMSVRSAIRTTLGISPDFGIDYKHHQVKVRSAWRRLSGVGRDPIRGVGCTGVWGDIVILC